MKASRINTIIATAIVSTLTLSGCSSASKNAGSHQAGTQNPNARSANSGGERMMSLSQVFSGAEQNVAKRPAAPPKRTVKRVRKALVKKAPRVDSYGGRLAKAAYARSKSRVRYDGRYLKIPYPWGDVPPSMGVCTDVVIRSYRQLGVDLQQLVHRDMSQNFSAYPSRVKWGLQQPDPNIDHRRVYNLQAFFTRQRAALPVTRNPHHYKPGDMVTWMVGGHLPHIGIVTSLRSKQDPNRYMIVHNIAKGPQVEDVLFRWPVTGHYRYRPHQQNSSRSGLPVSPHSSSKVNPTAGNISAKDLENLARTLNLD